MGRTGRRESGGGVAVGSSSTASSISASESELESEESESNLERESGSELDFASEGHRVSAAKTLNPRVAGDVSAGSVTDWDILVSLGSSATAGSDTVTEVHRHAHTGTLAAAVDLAQVRTGLTQVGTEAQVSTSDSSSDRTPVRYDENASAFGHNDAMVSVSATVAVKPIPSRRMGGWPVGSGSTISLSSTSHDGIVSLLN